MVKSWVINASPIISLTKIDRIDLRQMGLRISPTLLAQAIALAGE